MFSYNFYRILHLVSVFGVILSLGGMTFYMMAGGSRAAFTARKFAGMIHGIALFLVLTGGFGLLARLGMAASMPGWAIAKIVIWLLVGGIPVLIYKKPNLAKPLFFLCWALVACAQVLALLKPF